MSSSPATCPREVAARLDALDKAVAGISELAFHNVDAPTRLRALERLEALMRRQTVVSHNIIGSLAKEDPEELGGPAHKVIADWLRISPTDARRRIRDTEQLSARLSLTGQQIPARLPGTADVWHAGLLDQRHLRVIQKFLHDLPQATPVDVVERAEQFLAEHATQLRPDQLEKLANHYAIMLNPDGQFSDQDRAQRRGFTWCGQGIDGMSVGKLIASPELRANLDAWFARFAAPGMCNPEDQTPCVADEPSTEVKTKDLRGHSQRQHDALNALVRGQLGDPKLGQHNGLPVSVIASTTLQELTEQTGCAVTGAGTLLPISDLIRMASHARHYLAIFNDDGRPLYLGRSKRIATADQRIVLHAKDRGCTHPGCDMPGYLCEVHHVTEWTAGGPTNIDNLTFACGPHHRLLQTGWTTRKHRSGDTEWIPPPQLKVPKRTNTYHHPERFLPEEHSDERRSA